MGGFAADFVRWSGVEIPRGEVGSDGGECGLAAGVRRSCGQRNRLEKQFRFAGLTGVEGDALVEHAELGLHGSLKIERP